jgi:hypothetical protein
MAERGKGEPQQHEEAKTAEAQDRLAEVIASSLEETLERHLLFLNVRAEDIPLLVEHAKEGRGGLLLREPATEAPSSPVERDVSVDRDDAYYDDVRQAVGRGAPSVLLGTSTKALDRNLQKIRFAKVSDEPSSPDVPPPVRPSSGSPSSPSPSSRIAVPVPVKRASIWWKLAVTGIWAFLLLCTASLITDPSPPSHGWSQLGWFQILQSIAALILLWATAIVISVPRIRHGAKAWIRKKCSPDRSDRPAKNEPKNEPSSERRKWPVPPASPKK